MAVRVATDDGYFFPAATVCAFMHAASVGIDVTSNRHVTSVLTLTLTPMLYQP